MFQTYQPSGRFGLLTFVLLLFAALLVILLAWIYQLLIDWIPLIYINFLITAGFALGAGMLANLNGKLGHNRNVAVGILVGLVLGFAGLAAKYYFQYQTHVTEEIPVCMNELDVSADEAEKIVREQLSFWTHIQLRVDTGWTVGRGGGGMPVTGILVYLIWLIEAGIVLGFALYMSYEAANEPYSEKLNCWADEEELIMSLPITDDQMVETIQNAQSVDELLNIPIPKTDESYQFANYKLNTVPEHELEEGYLTVTLETITYDKSGSENRKETNLVKFAILSNEERARLRENAELLNEAMDDFRAALEAGELEEVEQAEDAEQDTVSGSENASSDLGSD